MKKYILNNIKYLVISILVIIAIFTYNIDNKKYFTLSMKDEKKYISVYVKGNVKEEKTVKVKSKTTIKEVLNMVGGIKENSDISSINLEAKVKQGDIIEIPTKNTTKEKINRENVEKENKININTADKSMLMRLTGIGEKTAEKIIEYRTENKFKIIEDIKKVSGIGDKKYEKIKNEITV